MQAGKLQSEDFKPHNYFYTLIQQKVVYRKCPLVFSILLDFISNNKKIEYFKI